MTDEEKILEYLSIIEERILAPIEKSGIREYCTATLLLLFTAIDGLGALSYEDNCQNSKSIRKEPKVSFRFKQFLIDYMGGEYCERKDELYTLRCNLVHNAINVESYLLHTETGSDQHLKKIGEGKFIFVDPWRMYQDLLIVFRRYREELLMDRQKLEIFAKRLVLVEEKARIRAETPGDLIPSQPPRVEFVFSKHN